MEHNKTLLKNLISSKKNIKHKIMEMKRGIIDSDHYFRDTFKPILDPLNTIAENNKIGESFIQNSNVLPRESIEDYEDNDELNLEYNNFFQTPHNSKINYDKAYGLYYDKSIDKLKIGNVIVYFIDGNIRVEDKYFQWTKGLWSLLCEKIPKGATYDDVENYYNILKITKTHLKTDGKPKGNVHFKWINIVKPLYKRMQNEEVNLKKELFEKKLVEPNNSLPFSNFNSYAHYNKLDTSLLEENQTSKKVKKFKDNHPTIKPVHFSPVKNIDLINFTDSNPFTQPLSKKGSSLYKNVMSKTQLVYYDDPNELVTRLNLLVSSQNAGNTSVNNEIISILEELQERKLIV